MVPSRHELLISRLTELGLYAEFRRWAMGDTICVADGLHKEGGLQAFHLCLYLIPFGEKDEIIDTCHFIGLNNEAPPIADLDILEIVVQMLQSAERFHLQAGRWAAENRWRGVTDRRCPDCKSLWPPTCLKCWVCTHLARIRSAQLCRSKNGFSRRHKNTENARER